MGLSRKWTFLVFVLIVLCLAPPVRVHAYIDPGTGNYLLQLGIAALFGALFFLKMFWTKIKSTLAGIRTFLFKGKQERAK